MQLRSDVAVSCSSDSTPGLGTSKCHRCGPKKQKKKKFCIFKYCSGEFLLWLRRLRTQNCFCEDVDLIPGLAQRVKDLAQVTDLAGTWHCCGCCMPHVWP